MGTGKDLTSARWRKSSYSGNTGGECIECAPLGTATWRKSTHSDNVNDRCVEVADLTPHIAVRDSKDPSRGAFLLTPAAFTTFVNAAKGDLGWG